MECEKNAVDFVRYIIEQLCEDKDSISIESNVDDLGIFITVSVGESDMGKLIGKQGQNISAVRTLVRIIGARDNQRINLKVVEPTE
jgi:predicted RNA-binding protein YlqC (UPF0109 family)